MKRILIPLGYYLTGYKAGGPIRSIANLVELLGDEYAFFILTPDRDFSDTAPYAGLMPNIWQTVGKAQVKYLTPDRLTLQAWAKQLEELEYDLVYLNSFFALQTRHTLLLRRLSKLPTRPIIIAPRGEFSPGALQFKWLKKRIYIPLALRLGLYDHLIWHATTPAESIDIQTTVGRFIPDLETRTIVAPNLATGILPQPTRQVKQADSVRLIFLARISRMKNLDFALSILRELQGSIVFDIYGPLEDRVYWGECQAIIQELPSNIQVTYRGVVSPEQVPQVLADYHLFFLPTHGENFGHAIVEAMGTGLPVLISDQTPWRNLVEKNVGWDLPLSNPERFKQVLQHVVAMDHAEFSVWSSSARRYAEEIVRQQSQAGREAYRHLFETAMQMRS
jgi:glycosyltransferase involved in cell wall biosynthesis